MAGNPMTEAIKSAGNPKTFTFRVPANNATFTPMVGVFNQPATITKCTVIFDGTGTSPVGSCALNAGPTGATQIVCAAAAFSSQAAATALDVPITTAAYAVRSAGDICTLTWTNSSGTIPVGTVIVEYFNHEV